MAPLVVPSLSAARARRRRDMAVDGEALAAPSAAPTTEEGGIDGASDAAS
eukprot:CAMPEP_0185331032 /NCGR_PEP_ID=MMETSP1363-20130426/78430_1 /TAXON_ID=38817 /ORGANISM="Gephyrocapsa oceanica, Strain RCC1303" /LENGTH=49 /DNA_ID= /DNA_START= /DNA_END= /DNA_ORIENTATION=